MRVWMWRVYLRHKGGQSSAMSLNCLPSEEWDGPSSRLLMAVFMNNANFVIIQKFKTLAFVQYEMNEQCIRNICQVIE